MKRFVFVLALAALGACREEAAAPSAPVTMTATALGHYCQMNVLDHAGPKAQVHVAGMAQPLFFAQVRDAIAYARLPEKDGAIRAIHVSDMGKAPAWETPGADNWILARTAFYVVGSTRMGGMGTPELVPFATRAAAAHFAGRNGGRVLRLDAIPDADVLISADKATAHAPGAAASDERSYDERVRALSRKTGG